jgi:hypothetical protein
MIRRRRGLLLALLTGLTAALAGAGCRTPNEIVPMPYPSAPGDADAGTDAPK